MQIRALLRTHRTANTIDYFVSEFFFHSVFFSLAFFSLPFPSLFFCFCFFETCAKLHALRITSYIPLLGIVSYEPVLHIKFAFYTQFTAMTECFLFVFSSASCSWWNLCEVEWNEWFIKNLHFLSAPCTASGLFTMLEMRAFHSLVRILHLPRLLL